MKKDKELEYRKTSVGKKLFKLYITGHVLLVLTLVGLIYLMLNEGNVLTSLMTGIVLISTFFGIVGAFGISAYLFSMQAYNNKDK